MNTALLYVTCKIIESISDKSLHRFEFVPSVGLLITSMKYHKKKVSVFKDDPSVLRWHLMGAGL